ncbi:MAG: 4-hydroxythreonine-4-phosphate dehydrogenase PdxA, partial [Elusimicrobiota bacterium]
MKVLITQGDPKGIGPEIIIKALKILPADKRKKIILIGDQKTFERFGWNPNLCHLIAISYLRPYQKKEISFKEAGEISFKSLELSVKLIEKNKNLALVTAPISKKSWNTAGIKYVGHTDYFRKKFKKELLMCFSKQDINTALVTEHIPLKEVHKHIEKRNIVSKSLIFLDMLKNEKRKEKILFAGLNPHCGETGLIGKE